MDKGRWDPIQDLFNAVMDLAPSQRDAFPAEKCAEIARRVTRRLAAACLIVASPSAFAASTTELTVPVHIHIVSDLVMEKRGLPMGTWLTAKDIEQSILPEVNRIWRDAHITFTLAGVSQEPSRNPSDKTQLLGSIAAAHRDDEGKSDPERIDTLDRVIDYASENPRAINIYFVPYLGEASQGHTRRRERRIVVGQWTDKHSKAKNPPEKFQLIERGPYQRGSLSRTVAHELGHALGLKHPDKKQQREFGLLMGGKQEGYRLTREDIDTARREATEFGNTSR